MKYQSTTKAKANAKKFDYVNSKKEVITTYMITIVGVGRTPVRPTSDMLQPLIFSYNKLKKIKFMITINTE